jgi:hypothetical protein
MIKISAAVVALSATFYFFNGTSFEVHASNENIVIAQFKFLEKLNRAAEQLDKSLRDNENNQNSRESTPTVRGRQDTGNELESAAKRNGYQSKSDFDASKSGNFSSSKEYYAAKQAGFSSQSSYAAFKRGNFNSKEDFYIARDGGFSTGAEFYAARKVGFSSQSSYSAFKRSKFKTKDEYYAARDREAAKHERAKREAARRETVKREAARRETVKREATRREIAKQEAAKRKIAKREAAKREAAKREAAKREIAKREAAKREVAPTLEKNIVVTLVGFKDDVDYSKKKECDLHFRIENNSYGTIFNFSLAIDAIDDRGESVRESLSASVNPFSFSFKEKSIPIGGSMTSKNSAEFKSSCKYLREVKAVKVKNQYCVIRNLPEKINCLDLVRVKSEVKNITFSK